MQPYPPEVEQRRQRLDDFLSEKERRRYAAVEGFKLGWGGITYISQLFECDDKPIRFGIRELEDEAALHRSEIRRSGGGRKSAFKRIEGLNAAFLRVIAQHPAGSPMDQRVKWTNLTRQEITQLLPAEGIAVSVTVVDQLLEKYHYRKRKAQKRLATGSHPQRNEQFENIQRLKNADQAAGNPVLSMEPKKEN